ncbi:MAG: helix-turn-helix domain-containing protein [Clostridia bacterium]|nr:helix-turn-helix domain-containing protein [Clostridia bacterium]
MEIGERILAIRKEKGLSQVELAKMLLVSRQTISQWETGQTVPSLDNIYRLRDILGISFDDLMTAEGKDDTEDKALEEYSFAFDKKDAKEADSIVWSKQLSKAIRFAVISAALFLATTLFVIFGKDNSTYFLMGATMGATAILALIAFVTLIRTVSLKRTSLKNAIAGFSARVYKYEVYEDKIVVTIYVEGVKSRILTVRKDEINSFWETENLILIVVAQHYYLLKKSEISENSALYGFLATGSSRNLRREIETEPLYQKVISVILFIASLVMPYVYLFAISVITDNNTGTHMIKYMWTGYLFALIPLASIIFGIIQRKNKIHNVKNIVAGAIVFVILCLFGSFTFIFSEVYDYDYSVITSLEEELDIDLPNSGDISTVVDSDGVYQMSNVVFSNDESAIFEKKLYNDKRWQTELSTPLQGCLHPSVVGMKYDYYLIYNCDTEGFNSIPESSGEYELIFLGYSCKQNRLDVIEYSKEIVAEK